ncbi:unnamed protein product, partial [Amoebophrya sp. A25]
GKDPLLSQVERLTVDAAQGIERQVVIFCNLAPPGGITGHGSDKRRQNVALSRGSSLSVILQNERSVQKKPLFVNLSEASPVVDLAELKMTHTTKETTTEETRPIASIVIPLVELIDATSG